MSNIVIARRKGRDWYVGGITNHEQRTVALKLDFLDAGEYDAELILDVAGAPAKTKTERMALTRESIVQPTLVSAGGFALALRKR